MTEHDPIDYSQHGEYLPDGEPCSHAGCLAHISHPCEGCGRIGGRRKTDHVCGWKIRVDINEQAWVECDDRTCRAQMYLGDAEARLNEYETLKAATERLSAEDALGAMHLVFAQSIVLDADKMLAKKYADMLVGYANILEGKDDQT